MSEILTCDRGFQFDAEVPTNTDIFTGEPYADCADISGENSQKESAESVKSADKFGSGFRTAERLCRGGM